MKIWLKKYEDYENEDWKNVLPDWTDGDVLGVVKEEIEKHMYKEEGVYFGEYNGLLVITDTDEWRVRVYVLKEEREYSYTPYD